MSRPEGTDGRKRPAANGASPGDAATAQAATGPATADQAATLGYEQARAELAQVVERLEAGGTSLEEALALWERGELLAEVCQRWLDGAQARLAEVRARRTAASGD